MPPCEECRRLLAQSPGDLLIAHLMGAHELTLREAELHAELLAAERTSATGGA